ncbi:MAG TPA: Mov34/MPN/PAD-1 family protein [Bacteroidales bacterium]|nr:Mov34/MPN/PAD-1 family protein [Bacteroidales bacterium]
MKTLKIRKELLHGLIKYGDDSLYDEVIAVGTGVINKETFICLQITKIKNVVRDPKYKEIAKLFDVHADTDYIPDPNELFKVISKTKLFDDTMTDELVLIFHTHPRNIARPSSTDIIGANYRGIYVIYSPLYKEINTYYSDDIVRYEPAHLEVEGK